MANSSYPPIGLAAERLAIALEPRGTERPAAASLPASSKDNVPAACQLPAATASCCLAVTMDKLRWTPDATTSNPLPFLGGWSPASRWATSRLTAGAYSAVLIHW